MVLQTTVRGFLFTELNWEQIYGLKITTFHFFFFSRYTKKIPVAENVRVYPAVSKHGGSVDF